MKILTKLMLASAVMVTSGFAVPEDPVIDPDPVIDGTLEIKSGAEWETTKDHTITSTGAVTLEKADVEGEGARWIISEGNTINVQGGSVTVVGEGDHGPTINLDGTMKLTKNGNEFPTLLSDDARIYGNEKIIGGADKTWERVTVPYLSVFSQNSQNIVSDGDVSYVLTWSHSGEEKWCRTYYGNIGSSYDAEYDYRHSAGFNLREKTAEGNRTVKIHFDSAGDLRAEVSTTSYDTNGTEEKSVLSDMRIDGYNSVFTVSDLPTGLWLNAWLEQGVMEDFYVRYFAIDMDDYIDIRIQQLGLLDASPLRSFAQTATAVEDLSSNISGINPSALGEVKLPFNCKFGTEDSPGMNLSNVDKVSFTKFVKGKTYEPEVVSNIIGMKGIAGGTYGDYSNDVDLGVVLPAEASKLAVTEEKTADGVDEFDLGTIAEDGSYNISNYRINTTYLSANAHVLAGDFTYNVGFTGDGNPIKISGTNKVATFKGDASEYAPNGNITLTNKTVYAGNNSFIKKSHAYGELEFAAAASEDPEDALVNEIPSGVEVSATKFSVGKGHTLTVKGKLRA